MFAILKIILHFLYQYAEYLIGNDTPEEIEMKPITHAPKPQQGPTFDLINTGVPVPQPRPKQPITIMKIPSLITYKSNYFTKQNKKLYC